MLRTGIDLVEINRLENLRPEIRERFLQRVFTCLLYTSDAADDLLCVDLGGRRIITKKKTNKTEFNPRIFTLHL